MRSRPGGWRISAGQRMPLDRSRLLAILNVTPDSFSDGGVIASPADGAERAQDALAQGADVLDVGGESTRPGAERIVPAEQIRRVVPAIEAIREEGVEAPITIDTTRSEVAHAALEAGADAVNDVSAAREDPEMLGLVAERGCGLILMHRLRAPGADRYSHEQTSAPDYGPQGVVEAVSAFLAERLAAAVEAGVPREGVVVDPGLGFGKTVEQNYELMRGVDRLEALGAPVLAGASRKSFIGRVSGVGEASARVHGSVAAAVAMRMRGVRLFRVHDVAAHRRALSVADRLAAG